MSKIFIFMDCDGEDFSILIVDKLYENLHSSQNFLSVWHRVTFKFETWFDSFIMSKLCKIATEALKDTWPFTVVYQRYKRAIDYDVQPKYYGDSGMIDLSLI